MRMIRKASNCFRTLIESAPSCPQRQRCLLTVFEDRLLRRPRGWSGEKRRLIARGHRDAARSSTDIAPRQPSDSRRCALSAFPPYDSAGVLFAHRTLATLAARSTLTTPTCPRGRRGSVWALGRVLRNRLWRRPGGGPGKWRLITRGVFHLTTYHAHRRRRPSAKRRASRATVGRAKRPHSQQ